ncbi:MAG: 3TM-type holin [Saprospiraceae bacterium]|nr:3TM-type holin [Saprospiraceae bacterium]
MIQALISPVASLLDKFIPDADERAKLAHEIATLAERQAHEIALAQIEVNKQDAKGNWFQSSWRPLVGWVCAVAFAYHFVLQPFLVFLILAMGWQMPQLPDFDMTALLTVLGGMLGLGSLRTFERIKGVIPKGK